MSVSKRASREQSLGQAHKRASVAWFGVARSLGLVLGETVVYRT